MYLHDDTLFEPREPLQKEHCGIGIGQCAVAVVNEQDITGFELIRPLGSDLFKWAPDDAL